MKRFLVEFWNKLGWLGVMIVVISLIAGIAFGFGSSNFFTTDTTPATEADFKPLEDQRIAIEQNHDLILNSECTVKIEKDLFTITFENDECLLTATYNKDFEIISTTRVDKAESLLYCIFWLVLLSIISSFLFFIVISAGIAAIGVIFYIIHDSLLSKVKSKFYTETNT